MNSSDGLVLYYHPHSFYCQKVVMALTEKRIPYSTEFVDIRKGEQYQPWFLKINPRGEVPVLKDGIKMLPDSVRINDYLEDNFSNGEHTRLIPNDLGVEVRQKVIQWRNEIDALPVNIVTIGSLFNTEFCSNLRYPFVLSSIRKNLKAGAERSSNALRQHAEQNPEVSDILLQKADLQEKRWTILIEKSKYVEILEQIGVLLDKVENELKLNEEKGVHWLCCNHFTIADISLSIFLDRLSRLGLANYFWSKGKRSQIDKYYQSVQKRDSYRRAAPAIMTDLKHVLQTRAHFMISLLTVVTVVVGSMLYLKRK